MTSKLSQTPAGEAPPGISRHYHDSSYNGVALTSVLGVFTGIAFIFFLLRIYTKAFLVKRLGWDDLTCTLGMLGTIADVVCVGIASIDGPLGKHMWNISLAEYYSDTFAVTSYILQTTVSLTLGLIKLTIFLFYLELFWPLPWCRWAVYIGGSLTSAFYLGMTIAQFYIMTPRPGETVSKHFSDKIVHKVTHLSIPTSSVGLAIDIVLFIIPLVAVIQLQIIKRKKIRLIFTFGVGIMAVLGSLLTLAFKLKTYGNPDLTFHLALVNFFVAVEMTFGICIASMPLVSRVAKQHGPWLRTVAKDFSSSLQSLVTRRAMLRNGSESTTNTHSDGIVVISDIEHTVEMGETHSETKTTTTGGSHPKIGTVESF